MKQVQQLFRKHLLAPCVTFAFPRIRSGPVLPDSRAVVLKRERMAGWQLQDALEYRPWRHGQPKRKNLIHTEWVYFFLYFRASKNRFHLRGKEKTIGCLSIKQWTHTGPVP